MLKKVSDYIPSDILKNPYYSNQKFYKCLTHNVLHVYALTEENKTEYPFSLFTQKYINVILETNSNLIALNHNPKLGWTFPVKKSVNKINTKDVYFINGEFAVLMRSHEDSLVFLFLKDKKLKYINTSQLLQYKSDNNFRKCTNEEKLDILFSL